MGDCIAGYERQGRVGVKTKGTVQGKGKKMKSKLRTAVFWGLLAGSMAISAPAYANNLINGGFDIVGPSGTPVTTLGGSSAWSAALG
jgi:hypothetical protein